MDTCCAGASSGERLSLSARQLPPGQAGPLGVVHSIAHQSIPHYTTSLLRKIITILCVLCPAVLLLFYNLYIFYIMY